MVFLKDTHVLNFQNKKTVLPAKVKFEPTPTIDTIEASGSGNSLRLIQNTNEADNQKTNPQPYYSSAPSYNPDPFIECHVHPDCGGGTKHVRQSICSKSTCCQIGGRWTFYEDDAKCIQDQNAYNNARGNTTIIFQDSPLPPAPSYEAVYVSAYGITYYCKPEGIGAIQAANNAYQRVFNERLGCAFSGLDDYQECLKTCELSNWDQCAKDCDLATKPACDPPTNSPEYAALEALMIQYCR